MTLNRALRVIGPIVVLVVLLLIWELVQQQLDKGRAEEGLASLEVVVPSPTQIIRSFVDNFELLQTEMWTTIKKAALGFLIGSTVALVIGAAYAVIPPLRAATMPLAYAFTSFPVFGLLPAIILAFGAESALSIAVIAALLAYFPILITLDNSFHSVPNELNELGVMCNASRLRVLRHIRFPFGLPALFLGFRLALPATMVGATIGELLGSRDGIGNLVSTSLYQLDAARMYASFVEIALVSTLFVGTVILLERRLVPWAKPSAQVVFAA